MCFALSCFASLSRLLSQAIAIGAVRFAAFTQQHWAAKLAHCRACSALLKVHALCYLDSLLLCRYKDTAYSVYSFSVDKCALLPLLSDPVWLQWLSDEPLQFCYC